MQPSIKRIWAGALISHRESDRSTSIPHRSAWKVVCCALALFCTLCGVCETRRDVVHPRFCCRQSLCCSSQRETCLNIGGLSCRRSRGFRTLGETLASPSEYVILPSLWTILSSTMLSTAFCGCSHQLSPTGDGLTNHLVEQNSGSASSSKHVGRMYLGVCAHPSTCFWRSLLRTPDEPLERNPLQAGTRLADDRPFTRLLSISLPKEVQQASSCVPRLPSSRWNFSLPRSLAFAASLFEVALLSTLQLCISNQICCRTKKMESHRCLLWRSCLVLCDLA